MTYVIKKTYGPLAAGTRVELVNPSGRTFDQIARGRGGYVTVRMIMSHKLREQKHHLIKMMEAQRGTFDIEADNLVKLRNRCV